MFIFVNSLGTETESDQSVYPLLLIVLVASGSRSVYSQALGHVSSAMYGFHLIESALNIMKNMIGARDLF